MTLSKLAAPPFELQSRKKAFATVGGHRTITPEEALGCYEHLIDPYTGLLRNLRPVQTSQLGPIHVYTIDHPLVAEVDSLQKLRLNELAGSSGKGKTDAQAKVSALFEGLERVSAIWRGDEIRIRRSYRNLKPVAIHPYRLLGFSARQYATREVWNASCRSAALQIPEPFDEERPIDWIPVWSLTRARFRFVPASFAYFGYSDDQPSFCTADSNGNAAGSCLEEAILSGLLEVFERDAAAIHFYNRLRRPGVSLRSFADPYLDELQAFYRSRLLRDIWALDVTADLGVPCIVAVSRRVDKQPEHLVMGFGCHLDPRVAVTRAVTELSQVLSGLLENASEQESEYSISDPVARSWLQDETLARHPYLSPDETVPDREAAAYEPLHSTDLLYDVRTCVRRAAHRGLEVFVLNLTRADIGVPAVKVIVPGLLHWWRRLGQCRLYDVPVRLGWLDEPLQEDAINPFSIVL